MKVPEWVKTIKEGQYIYVKTLEELAKEYDGIEVLMSEEDNLDLAIGEGLYWELYGWDCDSLLVFNKDIVEV